MFSIICVCVRFYRRPRQPGQVRRANRAGKPGKRARPGEASQSGRPANQARRVEPIRQARQAGRREPIRQAGQPGQVSSDMVIWRIPAHTLAHTLLIYGPCFVGPGRPGPRRQTTQQAGCKQANQAQQETRPPRPPGGIQAKPLQQASQTHKTQYYIILVAKERVFTP